LLEGHLVVKPMPKPKYTLANLLAQCDPKAKISKEDKQWLELTPVGNEIL
jgi:antitoxin ChpS